MSEPIRTKGPSIACTVTLNACNGLGTIVKSFGSLDLAREWVREHAHLHNGLHVQEVTTTTVRRKVFQPRPHLKVIGS